MTNGKMKGRERERKKDGITITIEKEIFGMKFLLATNHNVKARKRKWVPTMSIGYATVVYADST